MLVEPGAFSGTQLLQVLDLSSNLLAQLAPGAFAGPNGNLTGLQLANNTLTSVPVDIANLAGLCFLDLSFNAITQLTRLDLGVKPALLVLMVAGNNVTTLGPDSLTNCTMLEQLHVWRNNISGALPPNLFFNNIGLSSVHAFMSGLAGFNGAVSRLSYLETLSLFSAGEGPGVGLQQSIVANSFEGFDHPRFVVTLSPLLALPRLSPPGSISFFSPEAYTPITFGLPVLLAAYHSSAGMNCTCSADPTLPGCKCHFCPPGTTANRASSGCVPCPRGPWYQDEPAALTCKMCPLGMYSNQPGAASRSMCQVCPEGANVSTVDCTCLRGFYRPPSAPLYSPCLEYAGATIL